VAPIGIAVELGSGLVPYLLIVFAFTFVYLFMPNTRVRFGAAFAGAVTAGFLWHIAGWVFASFVVKSSSYDAIYSAFATLILFMIWLYLSWLILLLGADIAYYVQHPERVTLSRETARPSPVSRTQLALTFALRIGEEHLRGRPGPTVHALAAEGFVPPEVALPILVALERAAVAVRTAERPERYVPARALEAIPVKAVLDAVALTNETGHEDAFSVTPEARVAALLEDLGQATDAALAGRTLRDLAQMTALPRRAGKTGT
jgi:membrane protein